MKARAGYEVIEPPHFPKGTTARREPNGRPRMGATNKPQKKRRPKYKPESRTKGWIEFSIIVAGGSFFYPGFAHTIRNEDLSLSSQERELKLRKFIEEGQREWKER